MKSALYTGWIQHRRFGPGRNDFRYRVFMTWLDLAELPQVFERRWFWSARRAAPVWFRRADYLADPVSGSTDTPLDTAVRNLVQLRTGSRPRGPIRLLTHLRFFGYSFNPVSFYYVFDAADTRVETIVAEITNTPWKERHAYVLPVDSATRRTPRAWGFSFGKQFHVSPFLPMDMRYEWNFGEPGAGLHVHMENFAAASLPAAGAAPGGSSTEQPAFDATLNLRRQEITTGSLARALLRFPLSSLRVSALIYWQALKLIVKRTPFYSHPDKHGHALTHSPGKH